MISRWVLLPMLAGWWPMMNIANNLEGRPTLSSLRYTDKHSGNDYSNSKNLHPAKQVAHTQARQFIWGIQARIIVMERLV